MRSTSVREVNMELYLLDESFNITDGPIDEALSAVWEERFSEPGAFRIVFPRALFERVSRAVYVSAVTDAGACLCGRVEYVTAREGGECEIGGRLLEALICDTVLRGGETYTGKLSDVLRTVLDANLAHTPVVTSEDFCTIEDEVTFETSWQNLADWLYAILKPYMASFSVKLIHGVPNLSIIRGRDRSSEGADGSTRVLFSTSYGNIGGVEYERDGSEMKNFAYICGSDGLVVTVDKSGGVVRREIYKNASDIVKSHFASEEEYVAALKRRGEEVLAGYTEAVCVFAECEDGCDLVYGADYSLGDLCDVADAELGLSFALRVTGAATVFEDGCCTVFPTFGDEVEVIKKLRFLD